VNYTIVNTGKARDIFGPKGERFFIARQETFVTTSRTFAKEAVKLPGITCKEIEIEERRVRKQSTEIDKQKKNDSFLRKMRKRIKNN